MAPGAVANPNPSSAVDPLGIPYAGVGGPAAGGGGSDTAQSTDTTAPAAITGGGPGGTYDPTKTTPYQPGYAQQFTAPIANELPPREPIPNLGATTRTGAMAFLGDNILRGYMQGKAVRDMRNAVATQKQSAALGNLAEQAASQYYDYAQLHGADPNDPQLQSLKANVDATHNAQLDFMKQHINGLQLDKKTGELKPSSWWQKLTSNNPNDIAPAVYEGVKNMGPAVYHQTQQFANPQYIAQQKARGQAAQATTAAQTTAAQTAQTQATTAQQLAGYQQELQGLRAIPSDQRTPEQTQRMGDLQDLVLNSNPAAKFTPIGSQKPYQHNGAGQYFMAFKGQNGQVVERPMPPGFKPTLTNTQLPVMGVAYDETGKPMWTAFDKETGDELPNSRNYTRAIPPAYLQRLTKSSYVTADNAGNVTNHSVSSIIGPVGQIGQTAPGTAGKTEPNEAQPPSPAQVTPAPNAHPGHTQANQTPQPGVAQFGAAAAPPHGTPAASLARNPNSPASSAGYTVAAANKLDPKDPDWQPNPNDMVQVWAKRRYDGGENYQQVAIPANPKWLKNGVEQFMAAHGMDPGDIDSTAERTAFHAMHEAYPSINRTIGLLEQAMGMNSSMTEQQRRAIVNKNNGPEAAFNQWLKMGEYKNGISPGDLSNQINQNVALSALTGTAPWTKIGRNKQVYQDIQQHLPNVNKDSLGQMYDKLTGMRQIFDDQLSSYNTLHHRPARYGMDVVTNQQSTAAPVHQAPPTPQSHVFNADAWATANQGKDVNAAIAEAKKQGYKVMQNGKLQ